MRLRYVGVLLIVCGVRSSTTKSSQAQTEIIVMSEEERSANKKLAETLKLLRGTGQEQKQAIAMLEQATGDRFMGQSALNNLGWYYGNVQGDWKKAVSYYEKAAGRGKLEALINLAHCYRHGLGVGKDIKRADSYMKEAEAVYANLQKLGRQPKNQSLSSLMQETVKKSKDFLDKSEESKAIPPMTTAEIASGIFPVELEETTCSDYERLKE